MEEKFLSVWNAHRAKTIRRKEGQDQNEYNFVWRANKTASGFFVDYYIHQVQKDNGEVVCEISDKDLESWIVTSWKYDYNFEDLKKEAVSAFYATSHRPEERAQYYIRDYEKNLHSDLVYLDPSLHAEYKEKFRGWVSSLFAKHSRIMSAAITGPARFPTSRNNKANDAYDNAIREFQSWRENFKKRSDKLVESLKTPEQRAHEEWLQVKSDINRSASIIFSIDTHKNFGTSRTLIVSNLANRMETLANNGNIDMLQRATEYIKELSARFKEEGGKEIFTSRHKFWKLLEVAEAKVKAAEERANLEDVEIEFDGGTVVKNYAEDRLQILFDEKPDRAMIDNLKRHGFRWSPSNMAWQRMLNTNSYYACADVIPVTVDQLR